MSRKSINFIKYTLNFDKDCEFQDVQIMTLSAVFLYDFIMRVFHTINFTAILLTSVIENLCNENKCSIIVLNP